MTNCRVPADWVRDFSGCLYDWQTLVSGILALGAAILGALFLYLQIRQTDALNHAALKRRHNASRSIMPLALSGVSALLTTMADAIADEIESLERHTNESTDPTITIANVPRSKFGSVSPSSGDVAAIRDFVETLTRRSEIRHVAELTAQLQVLLARYNGFDFAQAALTDRLYTLLLNVAVVAVLNDSVFNYARAVDEGEFGIVGRLPNNEAWDRVLAKLHGLVFLRPRLDMFSQEATARINLWKDNNMSPWLEKFEA